MTPFVREAGAGPAVVCIHCNASSSGQWRPLMDLLAPRFHVLAPDTYGAGKSPPRPRERKIALRDEVALLDPVFARAGRFSLVGHSYGGGVALLAALMHRQRLRAVALYEPTPLAAFAALDVPVLLMIGTKSPLSSRAVAQRLARALPQVELAEFEGLGHMAPVTHPDAVNARIAAFLDQRGR